MKINYHQKVLNRSDTDFVENYEYMLLQIANAIGQFLSRCSTNIMIMEVPLSMSVLQIVNLIFIVVNMAELHTWSFSFMFLFNVYSGYLGGSIYLNTFFLITQKRKKETSYAYSIKPVPFED